MSEIILLDTHIWYWFVNEEYERFPFRWRKQIAEANIAGVASISCYEIALAHQKGKLELPCSTEVWLEQALQPSGIQLFPLTPAIACRATALSPIHKAPFDRLIIATALVLKAMLASIDNNFAHYPELAENLMQP